LWLHSLKVAQLLRSAACLHTNQSRSYLNHLVLQSLSPLMRNYLRPQPLCLQLNMSLFNSQPSIQLISSPLRSHRLRNVWAGFDVQVFYTRFTGTLLQSKSRYAGYYVQLTTPFPRCFFGGNINEFH